MKKVISFCLYGNKPIYIVGMSENLLLANTIFHDWEVRIYYNKSVHKHYIDELKDQGANTIFCENIDEDNLFNWEGMFWRMFPFNENDVDIWISRDADSRLSTREKNLIDEWINSNKTLHTIRDHKCHFNNIMGGMFGINNKLYRKKYESINIKQFIKDNQEKYKDKTYNIDQLFLNDKIWNILKNDHLAHISNGGKRTFESDIEIKSDPYYIGKKYNNITFPKNFINKSDKMKGIYWKKSYSPRIYWSDTSTVIKSSIEFKDIKSYYHHRENNGYPRNWSHIRIVDGLNIIDEKKPLISIAISTYEANNKGKEFLDFSFRKIMEQTYKNIEIVISDHSNNDDIKDLCGEYKKQNNLNIFYFHNSENRGNSSQNTNNAINSCNGKYIKILFMDDYLLNINTLQNIIDNFDLNPDKKWLVHSYKHTKNRIDFYNLHEPKISSNMIFCNRIGCPSCLTIRNDVKLRFDENLKWFMDSEYYYRLKISHGEPIFMKADKLDKPYMINLHHVDQITNTMINNKLIKNEKFYIMKKHKKIK